MFTNFIFDEILASVFLWTEAIFHKKKVPLLSLAQTPKGSYQDFIIDLAKNTFENSKHKKSMRK